MEKRRWRLQRILLLGVITGTTEHVIFIKRTLESTAPTAVRDVASDTEAYVRDGGRKGTAFLWPRQRPSRGLFPGSGAVSGDRDTLRQHQNDTQGRHALASKESPQQVTGDVHVQRLV